MLSATFHQQTVPSLYDGYNLDIYRRTFSQHLSVVTTHDVLFTGTIESNFALKPQNDRGRALKAPISGELWFYLCNILWGWKLPVNFMAKNLSSIRQQQQLLSARKSEQ